MLSNSARPPAPQRWIKKWVHSPPADRRPEWGRGGSSAEHSRAEDGGGQAGGFGADRPAKGLRVRGRPALSLLDSGLKCSNEYILLAGVQLRILIVISIAPWVVALSSNEEASQLKGFPR